MHRRKYFDNILQTINAYLEENATTTKKHSFSNPEKKSLSISESFCWMIRYTQVQEQYMDPETASSSAISDAITDY